MIRLTLFIILLYNTAEAQVKFHFPLNGVQGKDYWIVNYVDHDTSASLQDYRCGNKTYNGHEGTDVVLRSFKTMDSGVVVYAAADGIVFQTKDSLYDRNKAKNTLGLGNYVAINHGGQYFAYYGHLKKYSVLVKVGDAVKEGQAIGMVGSSGNSTDPHLHLEVYDVNSNIVDPFSGNCNANATIWKAQLPYDTSVVLIDAGMTRYPPGLDSLRERELTNESHFYYQVDSIVNIWIQLQGLRTGDTQRVDWYDTSGALYFTYSYITPQDYWYAYTWFYIYTPHPHSWGKHYNVKYYINNIKITEKDFTVGLSNSVASGIHKNSLRLYPNPSKDKVYISDNKNKNDDFHLYNAVGSLIKEYPATLKVIDVSGLAPGIYYINQGLSVAKIVKQ